jgi:hypothetical protein
MRAIPGTLAVASLASLGLAAPTAAPGAGPFLRAGGGPVRRLQRAPGARQPARLPLQAGVALPRPLLGPLVLAMLRRPPGRS